MQSGAGKLLRCAAFWVLIFFISSAIVIEVIENVRVVNRRLMNAALACMMFAKVL